MGYQCTASRMVAIKKTDNTMYWGGHGIAVTLMLYWWKETWCNNYGKKLATHTYQTVQSFHS